MKVTTSVSLSEELLSLLDAEAAGTAQARSEILEMAAWAWLSRKGTPLDESRDVEIYREHAKELERELKESLSWQAEDEFEAG